MARAALSVVYAHGRDDELAALRARVAELEGSIEHYMRAVEYELGLPHGSLVRLSADAEFR